MFENDIRKKDKSVINSFKKNSIKNDTFLKNIAAGKKIYLTLTLINI